MLKDIFTKVIHAMVVDRKGSGATGIVKRVVKFINSLGYHSIILRSDQEPAIKDLDQEVREARAKDFIEINDGVRNNMGTSRVIIEHSGVADSQANGDIESAIKRTQGQIRALKDHIEVKCKQKMPTDCDAWKWLVEHAPALISRYQIGSDGKTARQRHKGSESMKTVIAFGERVLFKYCKTVDISKDEYR